MTRMQWVCGLMLLAVPAFPQGSSTGRIRGAVTDQTGGAIAGATVTITDTQRGTARVLTTDQAGGYNAPELTPGTYLVRAAYSGFKATERQNISVEVGKDYQVDVVMEPGAQSEKVTVVEGLAPVETTTGVLGGTLSNQLMVELPVQGRNFQKLLEIAALHGKLDHQLDRKSTR